MMYRDPYMNDWENTIEDARRKENEPFQLTAPDGKDSDEDSLGEQTTNDSIEIEIVDEWDGQPDEAQEWHDFDPDCQRGVDFFPTNTV